METTKLKIPETQAGRLQFRIGIDPIERLQWALDFSQQELGELTEGDLKNLQIQIWLFARGEILWWETIPKKDRDTIRKFWGVTDSDLAFTPDVPTRTGLSQLQGLFRGVLDSLRNNGVATIGPISQTMTIRASTESDRARRVRDAERTRRLRAPSPYRNIQEVRNEFLEDERIHKLYTRYMPPLHKDRLPFERNKPIVQLSVEDEALCKFGELLVGLRDHVKICGDLSCQKWFAGRLNQDHCSKQCQYRVATRAYRERKKIQLTEGKKRKGKGK